MVCPHPLRFRSRGARSSPALGVEVHRQRAAGLTRVMCASLKANSCSCGDVTRSLARAGHCPRPATPGLPHRVSPCLVFPSASSLPLAIPPTVRPSAGSVRFHSICYLKHPRKKFKEPVRLRLCSASCREAGPWWPGLVIGVLVSWEERAPFFSVQGLHCSRSKN